MSVLVKKKVFSAIVKYFAINEMGEIVEKTIKIPRYTSSGKSAANMVKKITGETNIIINNIEKVGTTYVMDIEEFINHADAISY